MVNEDRSGIQMRKSSWQDGLLGTNCPIPSKWNWTYQFQVKDQIGSFFYFPSLHFQRAAGGFGGITVNNREIIPIPFDTPDGDITIMIGDWYTRNHTVSGQAFWFLSLKSLLRCLLLISSLFCCRPWGKLSMTGKALACLMVFLLTAKGLTDTIILLSLMVLTMKQSQSTPVRYVSPLTCSDI